jgi:hypothetical protein
MYPAFPLDSMATVQAIMTLFALCTACLNFFLYIRT